jgi:hemoglobin
MKILQMAVLFVLVVLGASACPAAWAQQSGAQKTLYERLGGLKGITMVSDDFINRLVGNKTLNKNPAIDAGRKNSPPPVSGLAVGLRGQWRTVQVHGKGDEGGPRASEY